MATENVARIVDTRTGITEIPELYRSLAWLHQDYEEGDDEKELEVLRDLADSMANIYVVVFGGAYDPPSYQMAFTEAGAWEQAEQWQGEMDEEEGDFVDVLHFDTTTGITTRLFKKK